MILTKNERGIAALADVDIQKLFLRQRLKKSEGLECQCQSEPKAKALTAYVGKTLIINIYRYRSSRIITHKN